MAARFDTTSRATDGEPVPDARFSTMDLAFDYATRLNCRDFGKRFDWMIDPGRDRVALRMWSLGRL